MLACQEADMTSSIIHNSLSLSLFPFLSRSLPALSWLLLLRGRANSLELARKSPPLLAIAKQLRMLLNLEDAADQEQTSEPTRNYRERDIQARHTFKPDRLIGSGSSPAARSARAGQVVDGTLSGP